MGEEVEAEAEVEIGIESQGIMKIENKLISNRLQMILVYNSIKRGLHLKIPIK